ncbi:MAG: alpha-2-macroglobulin, partial [Planctomycetaceae bacterium]
MAAETPLPNLRQAAKKQLDEGNWRDAYETYQKLSLDAQNTGETLAADYLQAVQCLQNLQQESQLDGFRESVIDAHGEDWRLLVAAANSLRNGTQYGFLVGGEFRRGNQRGGGQYVMSTDRDRVRSLQLFDRARQLIAESDAALPDKAAFYRELAQAVASTRQYGDAWKLQDLTNLDDLPDYQVAQHRWGRWGGDQGQGAPVDADGNPVFYSIPESWDAAINDGERWRWALEQAVKNDPQARAAVDFEFAQFLRSQFGVQTMQQWGIVLPRFGDAINTAETANTAEKDESGPYAVHTLKDTETIARLATGVKRFTLPVEFNFITIYKRLAAADTPYAQSSLGELAQLYEDRQQYPKAADMWRENIRRFQDPHRHKQQRLDQIVGHWGRFENVQVQPARTGATVDFRFRNGKKVSFEAHEIKIPQLIDDVKAYLKRSPPQLDWQQIQIDNIGYRLVEQNERKYLGQRVAQWDVDLDPRPDHFDRR